MAVGPAIALATERIVAPVEAMHQAISGRWFAALGAPGRPAQTIHDTLAGAVYQSIRLVGRAVGAGLDVSNAFGSDTNDSARAFVTGLWGDSLDQHEARLGTSMSARDAEGAPVSVDHRAGAAFPAATRHLVVLVHGLIEDERCWRGNNSEPGLAEALAADPGLTPVAVRYNSGLSISTNGSDLAQLLDTLCADWPVPVESIALVGHSMGGLVIRSACATAAAESRSWIGAVTDVVTLGAPHEGAPLERGVNLAAWGLNLAPETRPLAEFLEGRSAGIKDLRYGAIAGSSPSEVDPNVGLMGTASPESLPPGVRHHFVTGVVTSNPRHPVGAIVGDLLVPVSSGTGRSLRPSNPVVIGGLRHGDLLGEPAVIEQVMGWLAPETDADGSPAE
jgi:pimeloyl-ACP methyl ester carboxylesterase